MQLFADINLIVGFLFSIILPITGFIGTCILVRYKGDYTDCLIEKYFLKTIDAESKDKMTNADLLKLQKWQLTQKDDRM